MPRRSSSTVMTRFMPRMARSASTSLSKSVSACGSTSTASHRYLETPPMSWWARGTSLSMWRTLPRPPAGAKASVGNHLARQSAPELAALQEAAVVAHLHLAPVGVRCAAAQMSHHAGLQDRHRCGAVLRVAPQGGIGAGDDETAPPGERCLMHPAFDAVGILHQPPHLE